MMVACTVSLAVFLSISFTCSHLWHVDGTGCCHPIGLCAAPQQQGVSRGILYIVAPVEVSPRKQCNLLSLVRYKIV